MSRVRRRRRLSDRPVAVLLAGVTLFRSSISNWFANKTNDTASLD
jgi:hypothetical protein